MLSSNGSVAGSNATSMMLGSFRGEYYTWVDRHGNECNPPINNPTSMNGQSKRVLNIEINPGQNLGLMIRGGFEYGLGIYVTGVDPGSVAERAGLQRGDEVLEVNGRSFTTITHDKAVQILKSCRKMTIVASYIGKIPADNQMQDTSPVASVGELSVHHHHGHHHHHLNSIKDSSDSELIDLDTTVGPTTNTDFLMMQQSEEDLEDMEKDDNMVLDFNSEQLNLSAMDAADLEKTNGMIEEKARTLLNKSEHSRFTFYRLEYQQGFLPVQTFVRILLELLHTQEKYTLLTEVREVIRPSDLIQFDELIYNKQSLKCVKQSSRLFNQENNPTAIPTPATIHQDQQTLGVAYPPGLSSLSPSKIQQQVAQQQRLSPAAAGTTSEVYDSPESLAFGVSSQPGLIALPAERPHQILISHDPVVAKMQQIQQQQQIGSVTPTSCVRYKVRVVKSKGILGIAIEGGSNTPHRLPRVIDVNTEGSAYGSNLKPGQVLLTCDGKKLDGLTHEDIARSILDSYVDRSRPFIEFVVVEAKASFLGKQAAAVVVPPPIVTAPVVPQQPGIIPVGPGGQQILLSSISSGG